MTPLENIFRVMFSPCTNPSKSGVVDEDEDEDDDNIRLVQTVTPPHHQRSATTKSSYGETSSSSKSQSYCEPISPTAPIKSTSTLTLQKADEALLKEVLQQEKDFFKELEEQDEAKALALQKQKLWKKQQQAHKSLVQARAEQAVSMLREQQQQLQRTEAYSATNTSAAAAQGSSTAFPLLSSSSKQHVITPPPNNNNNNNSNNTKKKTISSFFPASSPRSTKDASPASKQATTTIQVIHNDVSFDDGISCISAHTLDEMARHHDAMDLDRVHSDVTQDPAENMLHGGVENWQQQHQQSSNGNRFPLRHPSPHRSNKNRVSPFKFGRSGPSYGTYTTKNTKASHASHSTTDFASVWRKNEENYWQDVVREEETPSAEKSSRQQRREQLDLIKGKRDGTITTAGSSSAGMYSSGTQDIKLVRHPSDEQHSNSIFLKDHEVLVMPNGTQVGEI